MGHQIIKQPDGRLAIYSDGVDNGCWLRWDMSEEDVVEYYAERAAKSARESARRTVRHVVQDEPRKAYYQFTMTFAEANAHNKVWHGDQGPEGPVDEKTYWEETHPEPGVVLGRDRMDNHLIFGAGEDDAS